MKRRLGLSTPNRKETGALSVEAALVAPFFFALIFGIVEVSLLMMHRTSLGDAVAIAAREASVDGNDADADYRTLRALVRTMPDDGAGLRYVIVYHPTGLLDRKPSAACLSIAEGAAGSVTGCNVYSRSTVFNPVPSNFGYDASTAPTATADKNWPAKTRQAGLGAGRDLVGVYVSATYTGVSGLLPTQRFDLAAVNQLEPKSL